jgi:hypothetical protein
MKKERSILLEIMKGLRSILLLVVLIFCSFSIRANEIWVSPSGSDKNEGSKVKPFVSLHAALRKARELRRLSDPSISDGIQILMKGGLYPLMEAVFIRPEDSGTAASPTTISAASGEHPVLSGGIALSGFRIAKGTIPGLPAEAQGKVWVADAPYPGGRLLEFRQLWVNDKKAQRAREVNDNNLHRLLVWDKEKQETWIPLSALKSVKEPAQMEMVLHQMWATAVLRIKSIRVKGDRAAIKFHEPENRVQFEHPWPSPVMDGKNGSSAFYLSNSISFLDQPGEWYEDLSSGKVYYWPRKGESLKNSTATVPYLETLVKIRGSQAKPVSYVSFDGIGFKHSTWLKASREGLVPLQAGMALIDAYKLAKPGTSAKKDLENQAWTERPLAGMMISGANHILIQNCRFQHMAAAGLDFITDTHHDLVKGCVFRDIGGNGIQMGIFSDISEEAHLAYDPSDSKTVTSNETISNNLLTDCTNEDWGCVAMALGYVRDVTVEHNEISHIAYTGISLGWGWTPDLNVMRNNRVHANYIHHYANYMYDVAGIYTLSAQPGTVISENCIDSIGKSSYVHDPDHWFYLYLDEGSSFMTVKDNWCPSEKFLANANGPGNIWTNNGPMVSEKIKKAAGLEVGYKHLLND